MVHILYHLRDLDGYCSGAITKNYFESIGQQCKLYPHDYDRPFPYSEIPDGSKVFMVDVTINPYSEMQEINKKYDLYLIDHHQSFIESMYSSGIAGIIKSGKAGCELCWEFFYPNEDVPKEVSLLGRYDVWDNKDLDKWNNEIMPFQMGIKLYNALPESDFWKFGKIDVDKIIEEGKAILKYQKNEDEKTMKIFSFEKSFNGYKAICLNSTRFNSNVFESVWNPDKYDIMMGFALTQDLGYTVSMYTNKPGIDVSKIATKYGGGGHVGAAGFKCKNLLELFD